jgi:hypothetical protein
MWALGVDAPVRIKARRGGASLTRRRGNAQRLSGRGRRVVLMRRAAPRREAVRCGAAAAVGTLGFRF